MTGMNIRIGDFRLRYPVNLSLRDLYVADFKQDTIAYVKALNINIRPAPFLKKVLSISRFYLEEARIHSRILIEGIEVQGTIGSLEGDVETISRVDEEAILNRLNLSDVNLSVRFDSFPASDTVKTAMNWKLLLNEIQLNTIAFSVQMPADSIQVAAYVENITLTEGNIDLREERYQLNRLRLAGATLSYDMGNQPVMKGLDPNHVVLTNLNAGIDAVLYQQDGMQAIIQSFSADERSGLAIASMTGSLQMNDKRITIPDFEVKTPYSSISAQFIIPTETPAANPSGFLHTQLSAIVDKRDLTAIMGNGSNTIAGLPPEHKLSLSCLLEGNFNHLNLSRFQCIYPGIFQIDANGLIQEASDSVLRSATLNLTASIQGKKMLELIPSQYKGRITLPDTLWLNTQAALQEGTVEADILLSELQGEIKLLAKYNPVNEEYFIDLKADDIVPFHFWPHDSIMLLTASFQTRGKGLDLFSDKTGLKFSGEVEKMLYKDFPFSGLSFDGSLINHKIQSAVTSVFPYIKGNAILDADLQKDRLTGMLIVEMDSLDLHGMNVTKQPFSNAFQIFSEFDSDLQKQHQLDITLGNWDMFLQDRVVSPKALIFHANANLDTTRISLYAGDLGIIFTGGADIETITQKISVIANELSVQMKNDSLIDFQQLRPLYPEMNLRIEALNDNPLYNYLQDNNIFFDRFFINTSTSPGNGLKMDGMLLSLIKDTLRIDTIRLDVHQDTMGIKYALDVVKKRFRRQEPYKAGLRGGVWYGGGDMEIKYLNERGEHGFLFGLRADKQQDGVNFHVFPENPILAFQPFRVNENNYVYIKNRKDISADLRFTGIENSSVWLHSEEEDGKMTELLAEINAIDLSRISKNYLQIPSMQGKADMSVRYVPEENTFMIVADANINNLVYEGEKVGELLLNGIYLPLENEEHRLDINLFHNQNAISTLYAHYQPRRNNRLDGSFDINDFALSTLNPFLTGIARLKGTLQSRLTVSGTSEQPLLNGYMKADSTSIFSTATGSSFRIDTKNVEIKDNTIRFDRYGIYAVGNNPLTVDGTIRLDVSNPVKSTADLRMSANNMQLFDSRKNADNIVYGRMFVNLRDFTAKGPINSPVMRGNLNLLGNTNMTLIMKESPLAVNDRMANLVTFTYFRDTIPRQRTITGERMFRGESGMVEGLDLLMAIRIDPTVKISVELDDEGTNRIELEGGGDLSYHLTPQEDMVLTGRYALSGGLIRYNMPIIANKTLRIRDNSYLDWRGDIMDPYLNLKATERIRTHISVEDGQSSRSVNFDAGIELKQRMENLTLQFTLDAIDDATLQNQLTALGPEERSKRAIGLLLTGLYLDEDKSGKIKFDMGTALNSFIQTEINQITGDLLKGVDFDFGMDNYDRMGMEGTNYSFRFSKRFYNDRLNVVLGGNVLTGDIPNDNNTFINDATIEYRLDPGGNRFAKLFYKRQYESLLEGEITKYGGGIVFRKKIRRLGDLFLFGRKKSEL
jgi:hypothetical protein